MHERIIILDFGSQYTQLIARRIRESGVYSEIYPCTESLETILSKKPKGIVLSGSPFSVYDDNAPSFSDELLHTSREDGTALPILGICYGLQAMAFKMGGQVEKAQFQEYGRASIIIDDQADLLHDVPTGSTVWMSHGDHLASLPEGFELLAHTDNAPIAAVRSTSKSHYGVQFHPEVMHTEFGKNVLHNFVFKICGCSGDWSSESFIEEKIQEIRKTVGTSQVILGLSGGVDSSVAAVLLQKAIGDQLTCIFVNNGLLRKNEWEDVQQTFRDHFHIRLEAEDASELFLSRLEDVTDPERKRVIIGNTFVEVFEQVTDRISDDLGERPAFLAQGTLYPDVIESVSFKGPSATIKTHHNVGGLPEKLGFDILEPFRELFKDEVREIGRLLHVPDAIVNRHPFPGPGLAVRVIGPIIKEDLEILREADAIFINELKNFDLYDSVWQAFAVLLPVQTVGVMGDGRTYENVCALRAVNSVDGMTADWARLPHEFLAHVSSRIVNEVRGINRTVYDISSKPPATIEWE